MEERVRILEMVREGRLSTEEASRLLEAIETDRPRAPGRGRVVRVRITSSQGQNVNITLPLAVADIILRFLPRGLRVQSDGETVDVAQLLTQLRDSGPLGKIIDITDEKGAHIEITVE